MVGRLPIWPVSQDGRVLTAKAARPGVKVIVVETGRQ
jgi:hypothetical protein